MTSHKGAAWALSLALMWGLAACADSSGGKKDDTSTPAPGSSADNPADVTVGTSFTGSVAGGGSFYGKFTSGSTAGDYDITLSGTTADLAWTLYDDAAYTALRGDIGVATITACDGTSGSSADESCSTASLDSNTAYYLEIENNGTATSDFTLDVAEGLGEGSVNEPLAKTGAFATCGDTFAGQVGTGNSYYHVTDAGSGGSTRFWCMYSITDDIDVFAYSNADFTGLLDSATTIGFDAGSDWECVSFDPGTDVYYLLVDGSKTAVGSTYSWECD